MSIIKKFDFENSPIYTIIDSDSEVWCKGKSVVSTLGSVNTKQAIIKNVDVEDKYI